MSFLKNRFQTLQWQLTRAYIAVALAVTVLLIIFSGVALYAYDGLQGGGRDQASLDLGFVMQSAFSQTILSDQPDWQAVQVQLEMMKQDGKIGRFNLVPDRPLLVIDDKNVVQAGINLKQTKIGDEWSVELAEAEFSSMGFSFAPATETDPRFISNRSDRYPAQMIVTNVLVDNAQEDDTPYSRSGTLKAVVLTTIYHRSPFRSFRDILAENRYFPLLSIMLVPIIASMIAALVLFGTLAGRIMARPITKRFSRIQYVVNRWGVGDLKTAIEDPEHDELGRLSHDLDEMAHTLGTMMTSQQRLAALDERNRLARDLHDTVKQANFAALMQLRAARNGLSSLTKLNGVGKDSIESLQAAESLLRTSLNDLDGLIAQLRPAQLSGQGLAPALRQYITDWSDRTAIDTQLNTIGQRELPIEIEQAFFRITQESLANVAKHSGAESVSVNLVVTDLEVALTITDDGRGFDVEKGSTQGYGMQTMSERAVQFGGECSVESAPQAGTKIYVTIPLTSSLTMS